MDSREEMHGAVATARGSSRDGAARDEVELRSPGRQRERTAAAPALVRSGETLARVLRERAQREGEREGFVYLSYRGAGAPDEERLTYGELFGRAQAIAATLQAGGTRGDRVLILCPPGFDYIAAFFACQLAAMVAVPAYPPRNAKHMGRLQAILADAGASAILLPVDISGRLTDWAGGSDRLPQLIAIDTIPSEAAADWVDPNPRARDLAFLQYTSGTTGSPKGVMVSHGNLMSNLAAMQQRWDFSQDELGAFWLPPYHDMGLIGAILFPLCCGFRSFLMPPASFLQQPMRWLMAISNHHASFSLAPNFAYELCTASLDALAEPPALELSSWSIAGNGAETVSAATLDRFVDRFAPYGFRRQSLNPGYGLAEITLTATGADRMAEPVVFEASSQALHAGAALTGTVSRPIAAEESEQPGATARLVGCGSILPGHELRIVDPQTGHVPGDGAVGEIWLSGPSVAAGYWNKPEESAATFAARLADEPKGLTYLRTGDLGSLIDGELYVLGRIKELLIIRGRNHYPQDIEATAAVAHVVLKRDRAAAFAIEVGAEGVVHPGAESAADAREEGLVLVHELDRTALRRLDGGAVCAAIRRAILREHEIDPQAIVLIKPASLPRTTSGKIQRQRAREMLLSGELAEVARWERPAQAPHSDASDPLEPFAPAPPERTDRAALQHWLQALVAQAAGVPAGHVPPDRALTELGIDSLAAAQVAGRIERALGVTLEASQLYDYPTIRSLAAYLGAEDGRAAPQIAETPARSAAQHSSTTAVVSRGEPIAIVGMACRFPGGEDIADFWELLRAGRSAVGAVPTTRWEASETGPDASRFGAFVEGIERFDPGFFRIAPVEALAMDPQQRLLLEVSWQALEDAGIDPECLRGTRSGVFVGISTHDYETLLRDARNDSADAGEITLYTGTGNANSVAAGRLSYVLGLQGPAKAIDTACSSSLVALHDAVQALRGGEADVALAGGVNAMLTPELTVAFSRAGMLSPHGRCKTFDAGADGYVRGEGCGVVVLKRLSDAEREGDRILAIIRASAVNQDGASNGLTAPNGPAQRALIEEALARAGLSPLQVDYLEAHGTGTELGDPIEVRAAAAAYGEGREPDHPLLLGSVKTNVGHLEAAAGVAGLIKTVLALRHGVVPEHLNFETPSPRIDWEALPVKVTAEATAMPVHDERPPRAGVSSFGFSGTNAHVILEGYGEPAQAQAPAEAGPARRIAVSWPEAVSDWASPAEREAVADALEPRRHRLLPFSGKAEAAVADLAKRYLAWLEDRPEADLADMAYTAGVGRSHLTHRAAVVFESHEDLRAKLQALAAGKRAPGLVSASSRGAPKVAFLFTGQGSQWVGMAQELYASEPVFRAVLDRCDALLQELRGASLLEVMFGADAGAGNLDDTAWTQPALYALQVGLVELYRSLGVRPSLVLGHSVGEYAAAYAAGVFGLEAGLRLIAERGSLMGALPASGAMAAVFAEAQRVQAALAAVNGERDGAAGLSLAADNGAHQVVSGPEALVAALQARLGQEGVHVERLRTSHAFHSALLEPMLAQLEAAAEVVVMQAPRCTLISNLTGLPMDAEAVPDGTYWRRQAREPVQFAKSLEALTAAGVELVVELGPRPVLSAMLARAWPAAPEGNEDGSASAHPATVASLRRGVDDRAQLAAALAGLYAHGASLDFPALYAGEARRKLTLPTYPFQRQRYWIEAPKRRRTGGEPLHPLLGVRQDLANLQDDRFEQILAADVPGWMRDHCIFERVVFPATGYVELALAAASFAQGRAQRDLGKLGLARLHIDAPLALDEAHLVQTSLTSDGTIAVFARSEARPAGEGGSAWLRHAVAELAPIDGAVEVPDLAQLRARCRQAHDVAALYERYLAAGLAYGPAFRTLTSLYSCDDEVLAELILGDAWQTDSAYFVPPMLLDGALQALAATFDPGDTSTLYLPVGVERIRWLAPAKVWRPGSRLFVHARIVKGGGETGLADLTLLDESGTTLGEFAGIAVRRTSRRVFTELLGEPDQELLYDLLWRGVAGMSAGTAPESAGPMLVVTVDGGAEPFGQQLHAALEARGVAAILGEDADPARLLTSVIDQACDGQAGLGGVLWLAPAPEREPAHPLSQAERSLSWLLGLVQALLAQEVSLPLGLTVVTRRGVAVEPGEPVDPVQASLWGFGRSVQSEQPKLGLRLIDLDIGLDPGIGATATRAGTSAEDEAAHGTLLAQAPEEFFTHLVEIVLADHTENQLVLRGPKIFAPRLERPSPRLRMPEGGGRLCIGERGSFDGLRLEPLAVDAPAAGEVRVQVHAAGLNFRDVLNVLGAYPGDPGQLGGEIAGVATAVGEGVSHLCAGDRVFGLAQGGFASEVSTPALLLKPIPEGLGFAEAATVPVAFSTALAAFELAALKVGERVLVHAGAGGVGLAAIQLARAAGAEIFATASAPKQAYLRALGIGHVHDSRSTAFAGEILETTDGRGVDVVLNSLTGEGFIEASLSCLARNGRFVEIGKRNIWSEAQMRSARPDVAYHILALDQWMVQEPQRVSGLLDRIAACFERHELEPLKHHLYPLGAAPAAMQLMQQARHVGKIVFTIEHVRIRSEVSYLITGGLGALGLEAAEWLACEGARHLVLVGRHGPSEEAASRLAALGEESGCTIVTAQADIAEADRVEALIARFGADGAAAWPPLGGVLHAAGVLDDGVITEQSRVRLEAVLRPKIAGAWYLHQATQHQPLDFFVLYSSVAATLGAPGQSNYAAANAFLDALGALRRSQGQVATSIAFGPWALGLAENATVKAQMVRQGLEPLTGAVAHRAMAELLASGQACGVVLDADWGRMSQALGTLRPPLLSELLTQPALAGDSPLLERLRAAPASERHGVLVAYLQAELQAILGLASPPEPKAGFLDLGMDSLMATHLAARLAEATGKELPVRSVFENPSVEALARVLSEKSHRVQAEHDIGEDVGLAERIVPAAGNLPDTLARSDGVLLTGATGFLGRYLAQHLLMMGCRKILCLVRAADKESAEERLRDSLTRAALHDAAEEVGLRILALPGDISKPRLGLGNVRYEELSRRVDTIIHNAADVSFVKTYEDLKLSNVESVQTLLSLCSVDRNKAIHFVSTLGIFASNDFDGVEVAETTIPPKPDNEATGYVKSKWVAERILDIARARGFFVNIYRPSLVIGDSMSGYYETRDTVNAFLRLAIELGTMPDDDTMLAWVVPVDQAALRIAAIANDASLGGRNFHITDWPGISPQRILQVAEDGGFEFALEPRTTWLKRAKELIEGCPEHPSAWVVNLLQPGGSEDEISAEGSNTPLNLPFALRLPEGFPMPTAKETNKALLASIRWIYSRTPDSG